MIGIEGIADVKGTIVIYVWCRSLYGYAGCSLYRSTWSPIFSRHDVFPLTTFIWAMSTWPASVTTWDDMLAYARALFGDCEVEDLLAGTVFNIGRGCFLIRVKGACKKRTGQRGLPLSTKVWSIFLLNWVWTRFNRKVDYKMWGRWFCTRPSKWHQRHVRVGLDSVETSIWKVSIRAVQRVQRRKRWRKVCVKNFIRRDLCFPVIQ